MVVVYGWWSPTCGDTGILKVLGLCTSPQNILLYEVTRRSSGFGHRIIAAFSAQESKVTLAQSQIISVHNYSAASCYLFLFLKTQPESPS